MFLVIVYVLSCCLCFILLVVIVYVYLVCCQVHGFGGGIGNMALAIKENHKQVVRVFLEHGTDVNYKVQNFVVFIGFCFISCGCLLLLLLFVMVRVGMGGPVSITVQWRTLYSDLLWSLLALYKV